VCAARGAAVRQYTCSLFKPKHVAFHGAYMSDAFKALRTLRLAVEAYVCLTVTVSYSVCKCCREHSKQGRTAVQPSSCPS
jgi:hypothetical protein